MLTAHEAVRDFVTWNERLTGDLQLTDLTSYPHSFVILCLSQYYLNFSFFFRKWYSSKYVLKIYHRFWYQTLYINYNIDKLTQFFTTEGWNACLKIYVGRTCKTLFC